MGENGGGLGFPLRPNAIMPHFSWESLCGVKKDIGRTWRPLDGRTLAATGLYCELATAQALPQQFLWVSSSDSLTMSPTIIQALQSLVLVFAGGCVLNRGPRNFVLLSEGTGGNKARSPLYQPFHPIFPLVLHLEVISSPDMGTRSQVYLALVVC